MQAVRLSSAQSSAIENFVDDFEVVNALADRNRQKIIVLLCHNLNDGLTVTDITEQMSITQPAVSHHLKILREAGLVSFRKNGLQSLYYLTLSEPLTQLERVIHDLRIEVGDK
ncbi:ArsR family transcriptional regulator [Ligilactobacillus salitolerans]|uniref:ArsR family transcriptional regulator n=1 Tax=Ligilactobacillus salitolerans TaxID=1808352 RepID=A0A401IUC5_9LACO|nr:metalloregulator ArsR/SmtB family transcription factor [Ligilactobacillus salitolerans]GBG95116.1 ArsR family transcriptional regulator [Ligilactobacillus salitolerans]